ncbi:MAG TPA: metallopeptidase TldD-related protein [Acidimicrobiales bacterium]|nr:metallopeptidase TldD-related protein [Acidimicrobiales bacterium]
MKPAQDVVEEVLAAAAAAGAGDCVVLVEEAHEAEVRYANNTTTTNGVRLDRRVTAIRFVEVDGGPAGGGPSGGGASRGGVAAGVARQAGDVDPAALVAAADVDARGSGPAADAQPLVAGGADAAFGDPPGTTDLGALGGVLSGLAGGFERARAAGVVLSGFAEHRVATTYLGSSTGLRRRHQQPTGAVHLVGRSDDGTRSAWAGTGAADFAEVTLGALEEQVVRGLDWAANRIELPAGRYDTVLPPAAVADMMTYLVESAGGQQAEEGRTVFSRPGGGTRVGEVLSTLPFDLWSDPAQPELACAPFLAVGASGPNVSVFDNGLPLGRTDWVRRGRLERLLYHRAGAARSKVPATAPVDNLVLALPGAAGSVDDLVAATERGLLLTCLWYIREVDPATLLLTGLTRDGVYVVEDGQVVGATNNFRFNESPVDLLARATQAGDTVRTLGREFGEWANRVAMPPLRVPDFNMSTVSRAS